MIMMGTKDTLLKKGHKNAMKTMELVAIHVEYTFERKGFLIRNLSLFPKKKKKLLKQGILNCSLDSIL